VVAPRGSSGTGTSAAGATESAGTASVIARDSDLSPPTSPEILAP